MQTDSKQIYKELADETGKSEQIYKDVGNFIFTETYSMVREPLSLITKLRGIGAWNLRRKRIMTLLNDYPMINVDKERGDFTTDSQYQEYLSRLDLRALFADRMKEYDEYVSLKKDIQTIRRETQPLLIPKDEEKFKSD